MERIEKMKRIAAFWIMLVLLVSCAAADPAEMMDAVRAITRPYYEGADEVTMNSPDIGRLYTDHRVGHAEMVAVKSLEVGRAIQEAVTFGTLGQNREEGHIALSSQIDFLTLEASGLAHDTGMCGHGYAIIADENGAYMKNEEGLYCMRAEDNLNFQEIRTFHSLTGGLYVLTNREAYRKAGFSDGQIDKIAAACMAHSKSTSGVRNLNSREAWQDCFLRMESLCAAWNQDHPDTPISFDRTPFEADDELLGSLASETLALRVGDVSRDSGPDAVAQSGERVHVDRSTINNHGGSIPAEIENAVITIGENGDRLTGEKDRQVHAGEQNIPENHTFMLENGVVCHEITVFDGCSAPRCTQEAVNDHLGEFGSCRDEHFEIRIIFQHFDAEDTDFFRQSWEDYRMQARQDFQNITVRYPWDEEVAK